MIHWFTKKGPASNNGGPVATGSTVPPAKGDDKRWMIGLPRMFFLSGLLLTFLCGLFVGNYFSNGRKKLALKQAGGEISGMPTQPPANRIEPDRAVVAEDGHQRTVTVASVFRPVEQSKMRRFSLKLDWSRLSVPAGPVIVQPLGVAERAEGRSQAVLTVNKEQEPEGALFPVPSAHDGLVVVVSNSAPLSHTPKPSPIPSPRRPMESDRILTELLVSMTAAVAETDKIKLVHVAARPVTSKGNSGLSRLDSQPGGESDDGDEREMVPDAEESDRIFEELLVSSLSSSRSNRWWQPEEPELIEAAPSAGEPGDGDATVAVLTVDPHGDRMPGTGVDGDADEVGPGEIRMAGDLKINRSSRRRTVEEDGPQPDLSPPPERFPVRSGEGDDIDAPETVDGPDDFPASEVRRPVPLPTANGNAQITRQSTERLVKNRLRSAFEALRKGAYSRSEKLFRGVLKWNPHHRQALLGLASVAIRTQQYEKARHYYRRILDRAPNDTRAMVGLISLRKTVDPVHRESRLKTLLTRNPDDANLHFVLGTVLVSQKRWSAARQAFANAFKLDGDNADIAFNLAISLDQLRQPEQALVYYRKARDLAREGSHGFKIAQLLRRIMELNRSLDGGGAGSPG